MSKTLDLICMGRCNVDLYVDQVGARLRDAQSFSKYIGGSAANICIGTAHLGLKSAMITRIGDDQLGWYIKDGFAKKGIDVSHIIADAALATPQIFLAIHESSGFERIFDYPDNASDLAVAPDDIDPAFIGSAKALLINGTLLSRENSAAACDKALVAAKKLGVKVAFDVDFRPVLWGLTGAADSANMYREAPEVTQRLQSILPTCDLVIGTEEEIHILGGTVDTYQALCAIREKTDAVIVLKRGTKNPVIFNAAIPQDLEDGLQGPVFPVEVFNSTGAGDGFMSGFLRGWITGEDLRTCCTYASASAALVVARHGCGTAVPSWEELQYFLSLPDKPKRPWDNDTLNHLHWTTTARSGNWPELHILAFDHRWQFEDMAGDDSAKIKKAKQLIVAGFEKTAVQNDMAGTIIDGQYGVAALENLNGKDHWLAQAVEIPREVPLDFVGGRNIGLTLHDWPQEHVVKCLVFYHLDDDEALRRAQDEKLLTLYEVCRVLGRELLLEILPPKGKDNSDDFAANVMKHFYSLGIKPDWWKLESPPSDVGWVSIANMVEEHDPYCRGVLLLGKDAPVENIARQFAMARVHDICKGFAIGRTIFSAPAQQWFDGQIDDSTFTAAVTENYQKIIDLWDQADPAQETRRLAS